MSPVVERLWSQYVIAHSCLMLSTPSLVPVVKPEIVLDNDNEGVGYQTIQPHELSNFLEINSTQLQLIYQLAIICTHKGHARIQRGGGGPGVRTPPGIWKFYLKKR